MLIGISKTTLVSAAISLSVTCSLPLSAVAQDYMGASSLHGKTVILPRGTTFEGRMDLTIGSKSRQGQPFTISMAAPVLANSTDVLIPAGSQVIGEVVEAIPASEVPHPKGMKPSGKLRVQLSGLRTPDGVTYPLVASLAGETYSQGGQQGQGMANKQLGGGIGYVGSQSAFEAVAPGMDAKRRGQQGGPKVMTRDEIMRDPIYGIDQSSNNASGAPKIRSLVHRGRDLIIASGSPVTIKLDAPFKMGISQAAGAEAALTPATDMNPDGTFSRRFQKQAPPPPTAPGQPTLAPGENPLPGILPDVPHSVQSYRPVVPPPGAEQAPAVQPAQAPAQQPTGQAATPAKGDF